MEDKDRINIFAVTWVAVVLAVFCQVAWGSAFPLIKKCYSLFEIDGAASSLLFGGIRMMAAGVLLLVYSRISTGKTPELSVKQVAPIVLLGTVQTGLVYFFEYIALNYCSGTNSSIVNSLQPLFLAVFAHLMFKNDRLTSRKIIGIIIGFSGVLVCLAGGGNSKVTFMGEGFIIISTMFFALGTNMSKIITETSSPVVVSGGNLLTGGTELAVIGLCMGGSISSKGGALGFTLLTVLALISAVCFVFWTSLCKVNPVGRLAPFQFVNPISGAVLSSVILGENILQLKYLAALVLVSAGILIINTASSHKS